MNKKSTKRNLFFIVVLILLAFFLTPKLLDSLPKHFSISSDADFYIVGYKNIEGYQLDNVEFKKVSDEKVEIVKGQINPTVKRANFPMVL